MPSESEDQEQDAVDLATPLTQLPFPPVTRSHILHCSYHYWHPRYRAVTPKARLISLSPPFIHYLRADGIILPPDDISETDRRRNNWSDDDSGVFSASSSSSDEEEVDPSTEWREIHNTIKTTIAELGGKVVPKLNWSAPKDATWINATNSMDCANPNDIYLLLKSSDFVTHDLEHAFDGCAENSIELKDGEILPDLSTIPYHLILRKHVQMNPALEFRCFVRKRTLLALCQRSLNHLPFLHSMRDQLVSLMQRFYLERLHDSFPEENFAFDVYVPQPYTRVWLIDINPWAPRTDPLLFSWLELLTMRAPENDEAAPPDANAEIADGVIRLQLYSRGESSSQSSAAPNAGAGNGHQRRMSFTDQEEEEEPEFQPELRLVNKNDPEAYNFSTPQYSAHKLPREVVEASNDGPATMREFAETWRDVVARHEGEQRQ